MKHTVLRKKNVDQVLNRIIMSKLKSIIYPALKIVTDLSCFSNLAIIQIGWRVDEEENRFMVIFSFFPRKETSVLFITFISCI